ncbi:hypothetical protein HMPREF9445_01147 [Bacteroides clarus YIT 12056]|uniref:Uncharacterized protein n=1 Tax=Bacteroides clarus YIT 12056 TaxID=762984 RepID=A0ABN0CPB2_9BACE|nr:hypothetical protein HMPREF9445_01147 [Bacteroides clarus YIT 12056]
MFSIRKQFVSRIQTNSRPYQRRPFTLRKRETTHETGKKEAYKELK